ncbi:MAG: coiled-coil domain-containing protein [Planctomycetota bacterium]|jgi:hypothetical protein
MGRIFLILIAGIIVAMLTGCSGPRAEGFLKDIEQLKEENTQLRSDNKRLNQENAQIRQQSLTLSAMKREVRLEIIDTLESITIGDRTGIYDKDEDGTPETLVVYVTPLDNQQDAVKAIGNCRIELWDLNQPEDEAQIFKTKFAWNDLNQSWGGNIFNSYYRLEYPHPSNIKNHLLDKNPKELTVKVTFTDYIGGKTLTAQKVITLD